MMFINFQQKLSEQILYMDQQRRRVFPRNIPPYFQNRINDILSQATTMDADQQSEKEEFNQDEVQSIKHSHIGDRGIQNSLRPSHSVLTESLPQKRHHAGGDSVAIIIEKLESLTTDMNSMKGQLGQMGKRLKKIEDSQKEIIDSQKEIIDQQKGIKQRLTEIQKLPKYEIRGNERNIYENPPIHNRRPSVHHMRPHRNNLNTFTTGLFVR